MKHLKKLFFLTLILVGIVVAAQTPKLFAVDASDPTTITIQFKDEASKIEFVEAFAKQGSYADDGRTTKDDFVARELEAYCSGVIDRYRTQAVIENAIKTIPRDDLPIKSAEVGAVKSVSAETIKN